MPNSNNICIWVLGRCSSAPSSSCYIVEFLQLLFCKTDYFQGYCGDVARGMEVEKINMPQNCLSLWRFSYFSLKNALYNVASLWLISGVLKKVDSDHFWASVFCAYHGVDLLCYSRTLVWWCFNWNSYLLLFSPHNTFLIEKPKRASKSVNQIISLLWQKTLNWHFLMFRIKFKLLIMVYKPFWLKRLYVSEVQKHQKGSAKSIGNYFEADIYTKHIAF